VQVLNDLKQQVADMLAVVPTRRFTLDATPWCMDPSIDISRFTAASGDAVRDRVDFLVIVTAWPTIGETIAWCSMCRTDQFGRPVAAHMNFNPFSARGGYKRLATVAMHELFHGLGFSARMMDKMVDANGRVASIVSPVTVGSASEGTKQTTMVSSSRVAAEARAHFGCNSLKGVELEDYDTRKGTRWGSHWEQRVMKDELMAPLVPVDAGPFGLRISRMTLAFFEDSGHYIANYMTGRNFTFGQGQGCDFVNRPARFRNADYQCPLNFETLKCTPDRSGGSGCIWRDYDKPLTQFQQLHPLLPNSGGEVFGDHQTVPDGFISCVDPAVSSAQGQRGGADSICIYTTLDSPGRKRTDFGGGCYPVSCPGGESPSGSAPDAPSGDATDFGSLPCEACVRASGIWCDDGWTAQGSRAGLCVNPAAGEACDSGATVVRTEQQCFPACSMGTLKGSCRSATDCASRGGVVRTSKVGAVGCAKEPVSCCVLPSAPKKRAVEPAPAVQKRAAGTHAILVGADWLSCPVDGGDVPVDTASLAGVVQCPSLQSACCSHRSFCNGRGRCRNGSCSCFAGFTGPACESAVAAAAQSLPSRDSWPGKLHNFLVEENGADLPTGDPVDNGTPRELPDSFGGFQAPDAGVAAPVDGEQATQDDVVIAAVVGVILVVIVIAGLVGVAVFLRSRRRQ
jgi:hypothetical protein